MVTVELRSAHLFHYCSRKNIEWMNDPEVVRYLMPRSHFSFVNALEYYLKRKWYKDILYAVFADRVHIGNCGFFGKKSNEAELRVVIGEKSYWGHGIGELSVRQLIDLAPKHGIRRIWLHVDTENYRALRIYQKCGFSTLGYELLPGVNLQMKMFKDISEANREHVEYE